MIENSGPESLVDLLDRVVDRGAVITGGLVIALADVELLRLDLRLLLTGVQTALESTTPPARVRTARVAPVTTTPGRAAS